MSQQPLTLAFIDLGVRKAPYFLALRDALAPGVRCLYYSRRTIVRGHVRSVGAALFPSPGKRTQALPLTAEALAEARGRKALALGNTKSAAKVEAMAGRLAQFFGRERVDAILVWNGANNLCTTTAVWLARQRGIKVLFAEHGYLPGTMQIDAQGVNRDASLTALVRQGLASLPPEPALDARVDDEIAAYRNGKPIRALNAEVPLAFRNDWQSGWLRRLHRQACIAFFGWRAARGRKPLLPPDRFVFLPLQVNKDSQLVLHSPLFGNRLEDVMLATLAAVRAVDPALRLVVKLHPKELPQVHLAYRRFFAEHPEITVVSTCPVAKLIEACAVVVTINSTVGFEALLLDKPVVTLGENFYTHAPLVVPVTNADELPAALAQALTTPPESAARRAFLRYVCRDFLTFGSYHDFSADSLNASATRIHQLLALPAPHTSAASAVAFMPLMA